MFIQVFLSAISFQKHLFFENFIHHTQYNVCTTSLGLLLFTNFLEIPSNFLMDTKSLYQLHSLHRLEFGQNNKNEQFWACSPRHATLMPACNTPFSLLCHPISSSFLKWEAQKLALLWILPTISKMKQYLSLDAQGFTWLGKICRGHTCTCVHLIHVICTNLKN